MLLALRAKIMQAVESAQKAKTIGGRSRQESLCVSARAMRSR